MRIGLRRSTQLVLMCSVVVSTSLVFQNCGTYQAASVYDTFSDGASLCTGSECATNPESILLALGNADPERLLPTDTAFDVGGYCDPAGYPENRIYYQIQGPTPSQPQVLNNACDDLGRFQIRVTLPGNYDFASIHSLVVNLRGVSEEGEEVDNPLGLNRRQLNLVTNFPLPQSLGR